MKQISCDTCRKPGACCSGFWLPIEPHQLEEYEVPFFEYVKHLPQEVHTVGAIYHCTRLLPNGRCGDYENRPELCRTYQAGQDPLCAEWVPTLKGIPIVYMDTLAESA